MPNHTKSLPLAALVAIASAALALLASPPAQAEDIAICAAVNHYPSLRKGADLNGCDNDARLIAQKLATLGFHNPIVLIDAAATKDGILGKIKSLHSQLHPGDRVVFFFAGHGTLSSSGESVILPSDAQDSNESKDIHVKDLYDAVKGLGDGVQKTIILDSCHSGGMIRGIAGLRGFHNLRPRFYVRTSQLNANAPGHPSIKRWQETASNGSDDLANVVHGTAKPPSPSADDDICYFTAAQKNEVANETEVGGEEHGLFTYYLANALKQSGAVWRDVNAEVSGKVANDTDSEQKPQFYPGNVMGQVIFGGSATPKPKPLGLDAIYNLSNPDKTIVSLKRHLKDSEADSGPVLVGSKNYFEITVGQDGYLVALARDPNQELDILYPKQPTLEALQVHAGDVIRIPGDASHFMVPDTAGTDGVKAILFHSAEQAQAFLAPFKSSDQGFRSLNVKSAQRAWREVGPSGNDSGATSYFTSEITTQIVPAEVAASH